MSFFGVQRADLFGVLGDAQANGFEPVEGNFLKLEEMERESVAGLVVLAVFMDRRQSFCGVRNFGAQDST
jgi:hypothetical protein